MLITPKASQYKEWRSSLPFDSKAPLLLSSTEFHWTFFKQAFRMKFSNLTKSSSLDLRMSITLILPSCWNGNWEDWESKPSIVNSDVQVPGVSMQ